VLLLDLILGIIGFVGIGHLYIGKIARGIVLLIFGLIIVPMFVAVMMYLIVSGIGYIDEAVIIPFIVLTAIWLIVLIWQTYDAHELAKQYNYVLRTTGLPPW
jgi:TM2 domain-containing membrane protein YozV